MVAAKEQHIDAGGELPASLQLAANIFHNSNLRGIGPPLQSEPLNFGLLLLLSGWLLQPLHPASLLALMIFFLYINRFQIAPEERILAAKFGDHYSAYCDRVRRWI